MFFNAKCQFLWGTQSMEPLIKGNPMQAQVLSPRRSPSWTTYSPSLPFWCVGPSATLRSTPTVSLECGNWWRSPQRSHKFHSSFNIYEQCIYTHLYLNTHMCISTVSPFLKGGGEGKYVYLLPSPHPSILTGKRLQLAVGGQARSIQSAS
jgi:hypothetical protein